MKKKVLVVGNSINAYALAKKFSESCEVFVAPNSNDGIKEFATCIDIRETSVQELLEFAAENGIDMTIAVSESAIDLGIADIFTKNNMLIFAPSTDAAKIAIDRAYAKKTMYKLRIPTPKFGIFEKQSMVTDYIKNMSNPFVIKTNKPSSAAIFTAPINAKIFIESIFKEKPQVIIEDYVYGQPFAFYALTDGYKALPVGSSIIYRHSLDGNGGQLTSGMGACSPNYKLSFENEAFLMNDVIYPLIDYMEAGGAAYTGILGINGIMTESGSLKILGLQTFMQDSDCAGILELLDTDIYKLFESCIIGSFSDEFDYIEKKDSFATSVMLNCSNKNNIENIISGIDALDESTLVSYSDKVNKNKYMEFEANSGSVILLTSLGRSVSESTSKVYEEIKNINFNGMQYRKDICKCFI